MATRCNVYELSRRSLRKRVHKRWSDCNVCFESLKHQDSSYANSIAAMREIYAEMLAVIDAKPKK